MKKSIGILLFYTVSHCCHAQVSIAPTGLLLDGRGQGVMYIGNTGSQPQEVRIQFQFGYPGQDSMGALQMIYGDTIREKSHGLGPSIKAYPSAFTLQPQSQQMVRLLLKEHLFPQDGLYFSRIKINSQTAVPDAGTVDSTSVGTQVSFRFEQFLPVFYQQGKLESALKIANRTLEADTGIGRLNFDYQCSSHTPYLGRLRYRLFSESIVKTLSIGKDRPAVSQQDTSWKEMEIALYFEGNRRFYLPWPQSLSPGKHCLELEISKGRSDYPTLNYGISPDYREKVCFDLP